MSAPTAAHAPAPPTRGPGPGPGVQLAILGVGLAATVGLAAAADIPGGDTSALLGLAGGGAIVAAMVGALVLRAMRTASLRAQAVSVALVAVVGTAVGVVLAANAMFVSNHDLAALLVVLMASATVAVLIAVRLGSRIGTASRDLEDLVRRLGDGDVLLVGDRPASVEMQRLAAELATTSARLDDARQRERAMDGARRQLIAWVSHDLRTPLAGIRAMVEALEDGLIADPADVARYHRSMRAETDRLAMLVDDLFELSRIEAGAVRLELEPVTVDDVVAEAVAAAMPVARAKGVELHGHPDPAGPILSLDPGEMTRVVRNLLDNAIRHTPPGGAVEVSTSVADSHVEVLVQDACGGIPEDDLPRVFDMAFRGDSARGADLGDPDRAAGGGLGLAIARGLVGAHDGEIDVANEGPGCCFTVRLPVSP